MGQLQIVNNWDKHRSFTTAAASITASTINIEITGRTSVLREEAFVGTVKAGKIVFRLNVGKSEAGAEIHADPGFDLVPVFDDAMHKKIRGIPVLHILGGARSFIETELLPRLTPFL